MKGWESYSYSKT